MNTFRKQFLFFFAATVFFSFACIPALAQDKDATAGKLTKQKEKFEQRVAREFGAKFSVHETKHWLIASDASDETVKGCGEVLEKCYRLYFKLMKEIMAAKERSDERMLAFIFARKAIGRAYYDPGAEAIFVSLISWGRVSKTLFHEATHQLQFERSKGRVPDWLVEGLAMYFESYVEIEEGRAQKVKGIVPMYLGDLKEKVREKEHVKVSELVGYSYEKFHGRHEHLNYIQSGALVHFLLFGKNSAYREKFKDFIQGKGKDDLYLHLGKDRDELEKEFLAYVPDLVNYTDKIFAMFKERYKIATEDISSPEFHICLARVLRLKGEFDESRKYLKKAAAKDREGRFKTTIRYNEGVTLYYEGKWKKARAVLVEVSGKMKDNAQLFYFLANACENLRNYPAAEKYYEKSAAIEPDFFAARYELALLYLKQDKTKKAIKHLEACTKLKPLTWTKLSDIGLNIQVSNIREVLGIAYIQDKQYDKAIETLKEYLKEDQSASGNYHLAVAYARAKKTGSAAGALDKAFALLKPLYEDAAKLRVNQSRARRQVKLLNAIADMYVSLGKVDMGLAALELVKKLGVLDEQVRATMAKLYARRGKIDKALEEVDEIIKMKPKDAFHLEDIAIALRGLKKYEAAEKVYEKAVEIEPKNQYLLFNFGVMYWSWKRYRKALQMWEKALAIDPGFAEAEKWAQKARNKINKK